MRVLRVCFAVSLLFVLPISVRPQASTTQSSPQVLALLQQSLAALTGAQSITDITLSGSARRIVGSDDETGSTALKALSSGFARVDLSLPSGSRSEVVTLTKNCPAGHWSGPDGVFHPVANHNLMTDSSWFFPAFTVARMNVTSKYVVSYAGQQTWNGRTLTQLTAYQVNLSNSQLPAWLSTFARLSRMDLFLDSSTLLPARLDFDVHPDNDLGMDIPVEIVFSDYRVVNGAQIPFHIERFLNNSPFLDLQFTEASLNSGISASAFNIQ